MDKTDLKLAVTALLGYRPSKIILRQLFPNECNIFRSHESLSSNCATLDKLWENENLPQLQVSLESFREVMTSRLRSVYDPVELRRGTFKALDEDCTGYISYENFRDACNEASNINESKSFELFQVLDIHNDHKIGYRAFEALFSD